jgi:SAM-dependent methyltransferase
MSALNLDTQLNNLQICEAISPADMMHVEGWKSHYFSVGRSALRAILAGSFARVQYPGADTPIDTILDFGCGHGRVARFLRAGFPEARIDVTDYDPGAVAWCVEHFGCKGITEPAPDSYDLIWLGSVFTHLPGSVADTLLAQVSQALKPNGIILFSIQGRYVRTVQRGRPGYGLSADIIGQICDEAEASGYGYADYPGQTNYGVSIADPAWFQRRMLADGSCMQIIQQERALDNHQDVLGFIRRGVLM